MSRSRPNLTLSRAFYTFDGSYVKLWLGKPDPTQTMLDLQGLTCYVGKWHTHNKRLLSLHSLQKFFQLGIHGFQENNFSYFHILKQEFCVCCLLGNYYARNTYNRGRSGRAAVYLTRPLTSIKERKIYERTRSNQFLMLL